MLLTTLFGIQFYEFIRITLRGIAGLLSKYFKRKMPVMGVLISIVLNAIAVVIEGLTKFTIQILMTSMAYRKFLQLSGPSPQRYIPLYGIRHESTEVCDAQIGGIDSALAIISSTYMCILFWPMIHMIIRTFMPGLPLRKDWMNMDTKLRPTPYSIDDNCKDVVEAQLKMPPSLIRLSGLIHRSERRSGIQRERSHSDQFDMKIQNLHMLDPPYPSTYGVFESMKDPEKDTLTFHEFWDEIQAIQHEHTGDPEKATDDKEQTKKYHTLWMEQLSQLQWGAGEMLSKAKLQRMFNNCASLTKGDDRDDIEMDFQVYKYKMINNFNFKSMCVSIGIQGVHTIIKPPQ